jgi:zinc/manganese transport system substrate-binding protein
MITNIPTVSSMRTVLVTRTVAGAAVGLALVAGLGACGGGDSEADGRPRIVVTTSILGDVVSSMVGDAAEVEVLMPPGADPHDFAPSAKQAAALREADVVVQNGLGFEVGLVDTVAAAEDDGVTVLTASDAIEPLTLADGGDGELDPHFFTDPTRMRTAAAYLVGQLSEHLDGIDTVAVQERADAYLAELDALDTEVAGLVSGIPAAQRTLVTNHEVFGYFADRYGFTVLGAVIPGGSTLAEPSAADLADLAAQIDAAGVPAIFAETSSPTNLADALAAEGTDVEVVELYSEALGPAGSDGATYLEMVRANAARIVAALGG